MPRREAVWLSEMRDAARKAHAYVADVNLDAFAADEMRLDATVHQLGIVGEASRSVSMTTQMAHPEVDWSGAAKVRNQMIHAYFSINVARVWSIAREEMPVLADQLDAILNPPQTQN